jgi:protein-tyrosine phosphatase
MDDRTTQDDQRVEDALLALKEEFFLDDLAGDSPSWQELWLSEHEKMLSADVAHMYRPRLGRHAPDITRITDQLWVGGSDYTVQQLEDRGITHVIDCRSEKSNVFPFSQSCINYLWNPTDDDGKPKPTEWFGKVLKFGMPALDNGGVVLAHCAAGINRGPSAGFVLLRAKYGWKHARTLQTMRKARPIVWADYANDGSRALKELGYA